MCDDLDGHRRRWGRRRRYERVRVWARAGPWTVEDLFDQVDEGPVDSVAFDPVLGYPRRASFDPEPDAIDDEWGFSVSKLQDLSL